MTTLAPSPQLPAAPRDPAAVRYAASAGLLVGGIQCALPVLARTIDNLANLARRDSSPALLSAIDDVSMVAADLRQAVDDAANIEAERNRNARKHAED